WSMPTPMQWAYFAASGRRSKSVCGLAHAPPSATTFARHVWHSAPANPPSCGPPGVDVLVAGAAVEAGASRPPPSSVETSPGPDPPPVHAWIGTVAASAKSAADASLLRSDIIDSECAEANDAARTGPW